MGGSDSGVNPGIIELWDAGSDGWNSLQSENGYITAGGWSDGNGTTISGGVVEATSIVCGHIHSVLLPAAYNQLLAQNTALSAFLSVSSAAGQYPQYRLEIVVRALTVSSGTIAVQVAYTDENGVSQNVTLSAIATVGTSLITSITTAGTYRFPSFSISPQAATSITVNTTKTGTVSYDITGTLTQLN
jgi:hypothetical protein